MIVNVVGLKKSGKTTVVEALVAGLRSKGYSVGTIKSMARSRLSLDVEGKDTWRHSRAGADFVISLSLGETVLFERHEERRRGLKEIERLLRPDVQFVVSEGLEDDTVPQLQVCCLRVMEDLEETGRVRGLRADSLIAISGLAASKRGVHPRLPVLDVMEPDQLRTLLELVLERSGRPTPAGLPGGPLAADGDWRPGVLPPGEFPEVPDLTGHGGHP